MLSLSVFLPLIVIVSKVCGHRQRSTRKEK
jgi:hypothetical protein